MINREDRIRGLREMADWLEANPDAPSDDWGGNCISVYVDTKDELLAIMANTEGPWVKNYIGSYLEVRREFPGIRYEININRKEVCTKRVVGTKMVEVRDPEKLKEVPMIEVPEDVVEWDCHPLLAPTED